jgi:hypothetical protein
MITLIGIGVIIILIGVFFFMRKSAASKPPGPGSERLKHSGPGEVKPENPRATGLD